MPHQAILPAPADFTGKLSDIAKEYIAAVREQLEVSLWAGAGGYELARRFADRVDDIVRFIVDVETLRFERRYARGTGLKCAVIPQGGYGRGEMNPWSDVDVLVLYQSRLSPYVQTINERLIYTLFDAGLQVGYATRTIKECLTQADGDLTIKTTLLDGRFLAGSVELGDEFTKSVQDVLAQRDVKGFCDRKFGETRDRHVRMGGSVFLLEPNVKDGEGGLRDLHTLLWIARVTRGVRRLDELAERGVATEDEQDKLVASRDFLLRVRSALHFLARSEQEKLSFDSQEQIAERFGYSGDENNGAAKLFMRDYYSHAAIIARTTADIVERLTAGPEPSGFISRLSSRTLRAGVSITGGQLVADDDLFEKDAVDLVRVFSDAQRNDVTLSAATQEAVRRNAGRLNEEIACSSEAVDTFMSILKAADGVYRTLGELNRLGVLGRMIPEFGRLFCMVQHDFYHVYTVDEHSLIGIRELERLRDGDLADESPLLTQVMRECDHPEILFLGMMFHDLGKGYGGDHDERGAVMVREVGVRLRLHEDDRHTLEFLVRHHLLMSMLAQNRDIEDPKLVSDFVRNVGSVKDLRNLYLLTFADMRAVGPKVWSGWKDDLLGELYQRAIEVFETGAVTEHNLDSRVERAKLRVLAESGGEAERARLTEFLKGMSRTYVLFNTVASIIDHWRLYESLGDGAFRSGVTHFPTRGFSELTVCAPDSSGLFARLCGVLSAHRLNILNAKIDTASTGIAIDTFRIEHGQDEEVDVLEAELWSRVRADTEEVLTGAADVDAMVAATRRSRPAPSSVRKARQRTKTRVSIDNEVSADYTVIDVYGADRPGLLFTLASSMYRLGLRIHLAKINTRVNQVLDIFYVTGADGAKILDTKRHEEVSEEILNAVRESDQQEAGEAGVSPGAAIGGGGAGGGG